jgi:hypothetical protein
LVPARLRSSNSVVVSEDKKTPQRGEECDDASFVHNCHPAEKLHGAVVDPASAAFVFFLLFFLFLIFIFFKAAGCCS